MKKVPRPPRHAVILAGGESRRFGCDKVWAKLGGRTFLEHVAASLREAGFEVAVSVAQQKRLPAGALPYIMIEDPFPFGGPLQALLGAFKTLNAERLLAVGCDMPRMVPKVLEALWEESVGADITMLPSSGPKPATLPAVYSRNIVPQIESLLAEGRRDLKGLLERGLVVRRLSVHQWTSLDPQGLSLININTQKELPV